MVHAGVFFIFFFHLTYVIGLGGVPFLYATEVAPLHLRSAIYGLAIGSYWAFDFLVVEVTPIALATIRWKYFLVFAILNAAMVPTVYFFFPETSGRSLEEVDEIFSQSKSIFDAVRVAKRLPHIHLTELVAEIKEEEVIGKFQPTCAEVGNVEAN
jgi:hypothetical protein